MDMDIYRRIGLACSRIPRGKVATYGQIALLCGKPGNSRQVGYALKKGLAGEDVPAHRVVNAAGILSGASHFASMDLQCLLLREEGVEVETVHVGARDIRGCIACGRCAETGRCVFDDIVNELAPKLEAADGLVVASPVYYASANATLVACLTRLFYSSHFDKSMKVGASVVCARRGGCSATFDELNKFFTIAGMPVASSQYWNSIHGRAPGEAEQDEEGRQTMRTLARNMTFLMRSIALGREKYGLPQREAPIRTNFIK